MRAAIARLRNAGVSLLSQSVLLRGVNDSAESLQQLFVTLVEEGIKPYYLHQLDLAEGTQHFRVPLEAAMQLFSKLRGQLPGYCLPQLMVDIPGGHGKVPAEPTWVERRADNTWKFRSPINPEKWIEVNYPKTKEPVK